MTSYYAHRPLGEMVEAIGGSYRLAKEERLPFEGRDVLYLVGHALFDTSCCGVGGCGYAIVQGFVARWHAVVSSDGLPMTEVEPVADEALRDRLRRALVEREKVQQVNFR